MEAYRLVPMVRFCPKPRGPSKHAEPVMQKKRHNLSVCRHEEEGDSSVFGMQLSHTARQFLGTYPAPAMLLCCFPLHVTVCMHKLLKPVESSFLQAVSFMGTDYTLTAHDLCFEEH